MSGEEKFVNPGEETAAVEMFAAPEAATGVPAPEAGKKKGGKKWIVAIAAVVVVAIVAVAAASILSSPLALVEKGLSNSIDALNENSTVAFLDKVSKGGSAEAVLDLETLTGYVEGAVSLKMYTAEEKAAIVAGVEMDGDTVLDASIFADKKNVAFASDVLLGKEAYGMSLTNFADAFNKSEFGPDGEFSMGIEIPDTMNSFADDAAKLNKEGEKVAKGMRNKLVKTIQKNAAISKEKDTLSFNGTDVAVTAVKIQANSEATAAIITDTLEYLRSDAALKAYLYDYADYMVAIMDEMDMIYGGYYDDAEEFVDEFYEALEDIDEDAIEDLAEELEDADAELSLTFYITKSGKELVGAEFEVEMDGEKVKISAIAGPTWKDLEEISIRADDGYSTYRMSYVVDTNDKNEYSAKLKVREDDYSVFEGEFTWDKKSKDFKVEMTDDWGDTYGLEGALEVGSKTVKVELESAYEDSYESDLGISVILSTSDKMPKMPSYTDVLEMSSDDFEDLIEEIEDAVYELEDIFYY